MLLIADSGSTKTDWRLVDDEGVRMPRAHAFANFPDDLGDVLVDVALDADNATRHRLPPGLRHGQASIGPKNRVLRGVRVRPADPRRRVEP